MEYSALETTKNYITTVALDEWSTVVRYKQSFSKNSKDIHRNIPDFVKDSWIKSKADGILPDTPVKSIDFKPSDIDKAVIEAAQELFNNYYFIINNQCFHVYNPDGVIIYERATKDDLNRLHNANIKIGSKMSLEDIGTTAHGLTLATGKTVQLTGGYSYLDFFNNILATSVPIYFQGNVVAVIEVIFFGANEMEITSTNRRLNFLSSLALTIRASLQSRHDQMSSKLIKSAISLNMNNTSQNTGIVTISNDKNIEYICNQAKSILKYDKHNNLSYYVANIDIILENIHRNARHVTSRHSLKLDNGSRIQAFITALKNIPYEDVIGYSLFLSEPNDSKFTRYSIDNIIGEHKSVIAMKEQIKNIAHTRHNVLILGRSGTGKELVAQAIHDASGVEGPFVAINCASIPANLIESELFGYVEGAFTGATKSGSIGKVEHANNGTLFLDEIGDMPLSLQPVLLRMLEERQIVKIGANTPTPVNVRVIAATNVRLYEKVQAKEFREDLFFRLSVMNIRVPKLCERGDDILLLANHFIKKEQPYSTVTISEEAKQILLRYDWPGNIRQLQNAMMSAIYSLGDKSKIKIIHLPPLITSTVASTHETISRADTVAEYSEKDTILEALKLNNGHVANTAKSLNISRTTLFYKMKEYGIKANKQLQIGMKLKGAIK